MNPRSAAVLLLTGALVAQQPPTPDAALVERLREIASRSVADKAGAEKRSADAAA